MAIKMCDFCPFQVSEHEIKSLEDLQDEHDFKKKTLQSRGTVGVSLVLVFFNSLGLGHKTRLVPYLYML
jgi:hypothetical protein